LPADKTEAAARAGHCAGSWRPAMIARTNGAGVAARTPRSARP